MSVTATRQGRPAYLSAPPRKRQSQIDAERAWALSEIRAARELARKELSQ